MRIRSRLSFPRRWGFGVSLRSFPLVKGVLKEVLACSHAGGIAGQVIYASTAALPYGNSIKVLLNFHHNFHVRFRDLAGNILTNRGNGGRISIEAHAQPELASGGVS